MPKKSNNKRPKAASRVKAASQNKRVSSKSNQPSLGRTLLKAGLTGLGGMLGPTGALVGSSLGDWGANLLGMGDYKVEVNSIANGSVPTMHKGASNFRVSHREYLTDVTGSIGFALQSFNINPGSALTFPWLSSVAECYQSYRIHGLAFEFVSTSADALNSVNTALGTVVMATNYNPANPPFTNKAEMEQYEYSSSNRPSRNQLHLVECDPKLQVMDHLFVRTGNVPAGQDIRFYDWGVFSIATVGMQAAATIGELWVTYDIEFFKPRIQPGGNWPGEYTLITNAAYSSATDVLGTVQTTPTGTLGVTVTAGASGFQRVTWPSSITGGRFFVSVFWAGGVAANIVFPARTASNLTTNNLFNQGTAGSQFGPTGGTSNSTTAIYETLVTINGYSATGSYIEFGNAGTLPATPQFVTILVISIPLTNSYI